MTIDIDVKTAFGEVDLGNEYYYLIDKQSEENFILMNFKHDDRIY